MAEVPLIYTIKQLTEIFHCAESTLWKWIAEGRFGEVVRVGRRTYVRGTAVAKIIGAE